MSYKYVNYYKKRIKNEVYGIPCAEDTRTVNGIHEIGPHYLRRVKKKRRSGRGVRKGERKGVEGSDNLLAFVIVGCRLSAFDVLFHQGEVSFLFIYLFTRNSFHLSCAAPNI